MKSSIFFLSILATSSAIPTDYLHTRDDAQLLPTTIQSNDQSASLDSLPQSKPQPSSGLHKGLDTSQSNDETVTTTESEPEPLLVTAGTTSTEQTGPSDPTDFNESKSESGLEKRGKSRQRMMNEMNQVSKKYNVPFHKVAVFEYVRAHQPPGTKKGKPIPVKRKEKRRSRYRMMDDMNRVAKKYNVPFHKVAVFEYVKAHQPPGTKKGKPIPVKRMEKRRTRKELADQYSNEAKKYHVPFHKVAVYEYTRAHQAHRLPGHIPKRKRSLAEEELSAGEE